MMAHSQHGFGRSQAAFTTRGSLEGGRGDAGEEDSGEDPEPPDAYDIDYLSTSNGERAGNREVPLRGELETGHPGERGHTRLSTRLQGVKKKDEIRRRNKSPATQDFVGTDGMKYERQRDAPGQNCHYVPPGNHNYEKYRLGTFSKYPDDAPVKVTDMAAAGFYFTGYKDRVKCFSCGIAVENWMVGDDAMDPKWHKSECKMSRGQDNRNVPVPAPNFRSIFRMILGKQDFLQGMPSLCLGCKNYADAPRNTNYGITAGLGASGNDGSPDLTDVTSNLGRVQIRDQFPALVLANVQSQEHENLLKSLNLKSEADRRNTFKKWPCYPAPYLPSELAKEGFFYLGNLDRTQCFSCSGVLRNWAPYDNVREQHEKHFPNCRVVRSMDSGNIPLGDNQRKDADEEDRLRIMAMLPSSENLQEPPDPSPEEQRHLAQYFPCLDAVNPHMRQVEKRIESFQRGWQRDRIRATPEEIAKAGFYYLGESDKTKCFYCNGGLQNWDPNDEPWTEHAKWFPGCEFVLRSKGVDFVRRLAEAHPNLNRPYIRNSVSMDIPPIAVQTHSLEMQQTRLDIDFVASMGFERERIEEAIRRKLPTGGYNNTQDLINDLLENNEQEDFGDQPQARPEDMNQDIQALASGPGLMPAQAGLKRVAAVTGADADAAAKKTRTTSPVPANAEEQELEENIQQLTQTNLCKKCKDSPVDTVFLPCGHLALCSDCAPGVRRCLTCNNKIVSFMKIYRS